MRLRNFYFTGTVLILAFACFFSSLQAQQLTPESIVNIKTVGSVKMQPQGNYIAYTLSVARDADEKPGGSYTELWVVPTLGGEARAYISKPNSVSDIAWTPDGEMITFRSTRKAYHKKKQVYGIPLNGGEAVQLTAAPRDVADYAVSPDGKTIAYLMKDAKTPEVAAAHKQGFDQQVEGTWHIISRIHAVPFSGGESRLVTEGPENVWELAWTPDSRQIIYRAGDTPFIDDKYMHTDNYLVSAAGGQGKKIYDTDGKLELAQMSPDGKYIAWLGAVSYNDPYPHSLFVLNTEKNELKNHHGDFPATGESFVWKDKKNLLVVMTENTQRSLYEVSAKNGKKKKILGDSGPIFGAITLSADRKMFATAANTFNHPDEAYLGDLSQKTLQRRSFSNPQLDNLQFGEQETVTWQGPDGLSISGVLIKPVGYQSGQRYPLQVQVHGGPESARLNGWNTGYNKLCQALAQRGIMVLFPNYRGSTGKGVAFAKGDQGDMMGKEFEDMLAGIDYLDDQGMIDPKKVGLGGGSYGGYTAAWAATKHSERFVVAVMFVGISNQISKGGMTDTPVENAVVHWDGWLYDNMDLVWDRSPLKHIKNAQTPTLILHGENDKRVPLNQAFEMYRALQHYKVTSELVVYPREGHGNRERAHRIDKASRALEWYMKYLKPTGSSDSENAL